MKIKEIGPEEGARPFDPQMNMLDICLQLNVKF